MSQIGNLPPGRGENTKYVKPPPGRSTWSWLNLSNPSLLSLFPARPADAIFWQVRLFRMKRLQIMAGI